MNLEVIFDKTDLTIDKRLQAMEFIEAKQLRELFEVRLIILPNCLTEVGLGALLSRLP